MGIYERDYYREEPKGFFLGGPRTMVMNIVIVNAVLFILDAVVFDGKLSLGMALDPNLVREPWNAWQLLTHGFAHSPTTIWHVAGNMIFLWIFGSELELLYGRREFLSLYLTLVIFAGACWVASENLVFGRFDVPAMGASGAVFGIAVLYVIHYPTRTFSFWGLFPVPAWLLVGLYLMQDLLAYHRSVQEKIDYDNIAYSAHLAGAAFGALYYRTRWSLGRLVPGRLSLKALKPRPKLRVHEPPRDDQELHDRLDQILEKIHREGEASLSAEERHTLEDASRRFQQRRR